MLKSRPWLLVCRHGVVRHITASLVALHVSRHEHTAAPIFLEKRRNSYHSIVCTPQDPEDIYKPTIKPTTFCLHSPLHHLRSIPHPTRTRNPISSQQCLKILIRTRSKVMRNIVIHIMHRNRCASRRRVGYFALRAREPEALAVAVGIDAHGAGRASVSCAAGAFHSELPMRVVGFVAGCEGRVGC